MTNNIPALQILCEVRMDIRDTEASPRRGTTAGREQLAGSCSCGGEQNISSHDGAEELCWTQVKNQA